MPAPPRELPTPPRESGDNPTPRPVVPIGRG
jgi:hypothetical protein